MINRYQIMSGLMALVAIFLVFVGFKSLKVELPNLNKQQSNLSFESDKDWDNDGLTNKEESYWNTDPNNSDTDGDGYLDGEEVASGHDPLIPGPDDLLPTDDNLTMKMSQLALAGLYEGSLRPDSPTYEEALNYLATAIADNAVNSFEFDLSKIKLNIINSDEYSDQKYMEELSIIYENLLEIFIEQMLSLEENLNNIGAYGMAHGGVVDSFKGSASGYEKILGELLKMNIPNRWANNHLGIVKLVGELSQTSQSVISGSDDPIKAAVGLNKIFQLWNMLPKITAEYSEKIKALGLDLSETIF